MSLATLRAMRIERVRPENPISLVVGDRPKGFIDSEDKVLILNGVDPGLMDFRPMVGLQFAMYLFGDKVDLAQRALDAAVSAGAKCIAVSLPCGVHLPVNFIDQKDASRLKYWINNYREFLCQ